MMATTAGQVLRPFLQPFEGAGLHLRNRFALAPMTRLKATDGVGGESDVDYYRRRAEGGAGLIITEGTLLKVPTSGFSAKVPSFFGEQAGRSWRAVAQAVHEAGSAIVPQLWHTGIQRGLNSELNPGVPPVSPSGRDLDGAVVAEPLTHAEMDEIVAAYAEAAASAMQWGFDGVELHGAHGYLLDQFLWERTNTRADRYRERTLFPVEVVRAVRAAIGPTAPLVYRFSQWKADRYDARIADSPAELESILGALADAGTTVFHPSTRRHWQPAFDSSPLSLAGWTKKITGLPVIAVGSVGVDATFGANAPANDSQLTRLQLLAQQFEEGEFDIIALGRALLADAAWINKTMSGEGDVRPYRRVPGSESLTERTY